MPNKSDRIIPPQSVCAICDASDWAALPTPGTQSMTTAGRIVPGLLGKAICKGCGAVQKVFAPRLADTDFYERQYTYYDRPGAQSRDVVRYKALAEWVATAVAPRKPKHIFDIGCGQGSTLRSLREFFPDAVLGGIEPSADAVATARAEGLNVIEGRIDRTKISEKFDLVFSNNVLQHVTDPVGFLLQQKELLTDDGILVLSCPDGTLPNVELLMADQNFSYRPPHLIALAAKAGLKVVKALPCPGGPLRNEQLVVLQPDNAPAAPSLPDAKDIEASRQALTEYLNHWASLDEFLVKSIAGAKRVFNFGGGLWSYVLAGYCPRYWAQVKCCLVDGFSGRCIDKEVVPFESVDVNAGDVLVLGTNPYVQQKLVDRFKQAGLKAVAFDHLSPH